MYQPGRKQRPKLLGRHRKHLKCNFEAKRGAHTCNLKPSGGTGGWASLDRRNSSLTQILEDAAPYGQGVWCGQIGQQDFSLPFSICPLPESLFL